MREWLELYGLAACKCTLDFSCRYIASACSSLIACVISKSFSSLLCFFGEVLWLSAWILEAALLLRVVWMVWELRDGNGGWTHFIPVSLSFSPSFSSFHCLSQPPHFHIELPKGTYSPHSSSFSTTTPEKLEGRSSITLQSPHDYMIQIKTTPNIHCNSLTALSKSLTCASKSWIQIIIARVFSTSFWGSLISICVSLHGFFFGEGAEAEADRANTDKGFIYQKGSMIIFRLRLRCWCWQIFVPVQCDAVIANAVVGLMVCRSRWIIGRFGCCITVLCSSSIFEVRTSRERWQNPSCISVSYIVFSFYFDF